MRIALTTNVLAIPPTYFVVNHAMRLRDRHEFRVFALSADIRDDSINLPISSFATGWPRGAKARDVSAAFAGRAMGQAVTRFEPDLVHQHFATWSGPAITASRQLGVPLLATLHGYDVRAVNGHSLNPVLRWHQRNVRAVQRHADLSLAVSRYLADEAIAGGFDHRRLEVHYQGVDAEYFTPASTAGESKVPTIVFVGALEPHKGPLELLSASQNLVGRYDHRLVFVGVGSLEGHLVASSAGSPHVEFRGRLSRDQVRDVLRESTALVLPSRSQPGGAEAAGLVLLEAQACGTPVIAYDTGGTSEMMNEGSTGLLVKEGDVGALSGAIGDVLALTLGEFGKMRTAARSFVERARSLTLSCSQLDEYYLDLKGSGKAR